MPRIYAESGGMEGGISVERLTYRDANGEAWYSDAGTEADRLHFIADMEDILGDDYDMDRLRELAEADREGRCVPVVRCRECKHWEDWGACGHTDNGFDSPPMGPDDFCSKGERSTD